MTPDKKSACQIGWPTGFVFHAAEWEPAMPIMIPLRNYGTNGAISSAPSGGRRPDDIIPPGVYCGFRWVRGSWTASPGGAWRTRIDDHAYSDHADFPLLMRGGFNRVLSDPYFRHYPPPGEKGSFAHRLRQRGARGISVSQMPASPRGLTRGAAL